MGRNQRNLIRFAKNANGWFTYGKDGATLSAVKSLEKRGLIHVNEFRQCIWWEYYDASQKAQEM